MARYGIRTRNLTPAHLLPVTAYLHRELCMTVSARLQELTVDNAEYRQRLVALTETHQGLAEELATAEAEACSAAVAHAHAVTRSATQTASILRSFVEL